jgi:cysteine desulfurase / selenocysteine lyase
MTAAAQKRTAAAPYDVERIRADFPILHHQVQGKRLAYLDNGASAQKPRAVIDTISRVYETEYANVHRGVHYLSQKATDAMEGAREKVRAFLNAGEAREIIFARGATEGINLVAHSFVRRFMKPGDEVLIATYEHHSNIVPWQMAREDRGIVLKVAPIDDNGELILEEFAKLVTDRTKLVAIAHVSNALGTITPVEEVIRIAHSKGAKVLLDGCQAVPHIPVDVRALDCDFYVFSGHKLYGPSGIGVLYGKAGLLEAMPPYQGGGEMIEVVTFEKTTYAQLPFKFEAGTPHIDGTIGLGAAIDYVTGVGLDRIGAHEHALLEHATRSLMALNNVRIIGTAKNKAAIVSFVVDGVHPHDVGTILDQEGVAVRTGHHCAQPVMERYDLPATVRASFGLYNSHEDIDQMLAGLRTVQRIFG